MKREQLEHGKKYAAAQTAARPQPAWGAVTLTLSLENLTGWSILQPLAIPMGGVKPLLEVPVDK